MNYVWKPIAAIDVLDRLILELGDVRTAVRMVIEIEHDGTIYGTTDGRLLRFSQARWGFEQREAGPLSTDEDLQGKVLRRMTDGLRA
jgi:hypothetical protein